MSTRLAIAVLAGSAAVLVANAPLTAGASPPGAPVPCNGVHLEDAVGDGLYSSGGFADFLGLTEEPAPDNLEVVRGFFNVNAGVVTANIVIKNLDKTIPDPPGASGGNWYYTYFLYQDAVRFVRAVNADGGDIAYAYGTVSTGTPEGLADGNYTTDGDTTGSFVEGPEGVISIVVPEELGGKPGETLLGAGFTAETIEGASDAAGLNHQADTAPDEYSVTAPNGKDYTVVECPAAPTTGGGGTTTPPPSGGGTTAPPPSTGKAPTTLSALPFSAARSLGSARKAKKKKSLKLKVSATKPISNLRLAVKPASGKGATVAKASVASLKAGSSTIKLKATKKVKKGKYLLIATGVVDGKAQTVSIKVSFKK